MNVTLNGAGYRSTIAIYGGKFHIPARKEIRDAAKLAISPELSLQRSSVRRSTRFRSLGAKSMWRP